MIQHGETQSLPAVEIDLRHGSGKGAYTQNEALALRRGNGATGVQQVEGVRGLKNLLIGWQRQALINQVLALPLAMIELMEEGVDGGVLEPRVHIRSKTLSTPCRYIAMRSRP